MLSPRLLHRLAASLLVVLTVEPAAALCLSARCTDRAAVDAARARAAASCECVLATDHSDYVRCAKGVIDAAVADGSLPKRCRTRARRCERERACGEAVHGFTDSGGVSIHHVSVGEGPLVVMVHGFPDYWYTWHRQMAALADDHRVVAIDTRGYNLSGQPTGVSQYSMLLLVADVEAVIRDLGYDRATVVGHDWGGAIAWTFAMLRPEMTERLIVLNLPHPRGLQRELATNPQQAANSQYARDLMMDGSHLSLSAELLAAIAAGAGERDRYVEAFERSDFEAMTNYYKANYPQEPYEEDTSPVIKITAPTLVIHGLADPFLLAAGHNDTWEWLDAELTLVTIPGVNHWVQRDAADTVSRVVVDWLGR